MWSRAASRRPRRLLLPVLVASATVLVGAPAASAEPAAPVVLDPDHGVLVGLHATENVGPVDVTGAWTTEAVRPVPVSYGGSVTIDLPDLVDGVPTQALVELYPSQDAAAPTRVYDSASAVPADRVALTPLGAGQYRVDLPADDGVNGPVALVWLKPLESTAGPVSASNAGARDVFGYWLQFAPAAPPAVTLAPQLVLSHYVAGPALRAGEALDITLPVASRWSGHGFSSLSGGTFTLHAVDAHDLRTGAAGVALAPTFSADGRTASVTLPRETAAGRYEITVVLGAGTAPVLAQSVITLDEVGPAVDAGARPAANAGLRSETGVESEPAATRNWALAGLGAGMVLAAGAVGTVVVRSRRADR